MIDWRNDNVSATPGYISQLANVAAYRRSTNEIPSNCAGAHVNSNPSTIATIPLGQGRTCFGNSLPFNGWILMTTDTVKDGAQIFRENCGPKSRMLVIGGTS
jgi:hypothetical protein